MANGDTATLPMPSAIPPNLTQPQQPQMDPQKKLFLAQLLQRMGPDMFKALQQNQPGASQQQPQQGGQPQAPMLNAPVPAQMDTKFDPMSTMGSLPPPVAQQPGPISGGTPSGSAELLAKLDPKHATTFMGIQGVNQFISQSFQKQDEKQKAEAANAAQALMSALESAKTTGDFSPAQHILENNEKLFNKVYKGWLQKSQEAQKESQKPPKKEKPPDPEIQGFEAGLASYLGKGAAKQPGVPQPPTSLQGRSGAQYMIPQASPSQAVAQQATSNVMQQQRQAPGQQVLSAEERAKLQELNLGIQEKQLGVQRAQYEAEKAKNDTGARAAEYATKLAEATTAHLKALIDKDITIGELRDKLIMKQGTKTPQMTEADVRKMSAAQQASDYLADMVAKAKSFKSNDISALRGMLTTAGATSLIKGLPPDSWLRNWSKPEDVSTFKENFDKYVESLKAGINRNASKSGKPASASATPQTGPKPGDVEGGHRFKGGDPSDQNNWEIVAGAQ